LTPAFEIREDLILSELLNKQMIIYDDADYYRREVKNEKANRK